MAPQRFDLTDDEIVILHHVIYELTERHEFEQLLPNPGDRQPLHNLLALVEREDAATFSNDYEALVEQARRRLVPEAD